MLTLLLGALVAATPPPPPAEPEARVAHYVLQEFERVGRRAPQVDPALTQAARSLARRALEDSLAGAVEGSTLTQAVSDAGGADPTPRFYLVRAGERDHALQKILERKDLNQERATHMGVGVESQGPLTALVVLLAERKATLQRFPRVLDTAGTSRVLCGEFAGELRGAQVYVTLPDGRVERPSLTREVDASFCTRLLFTRPGEYTVEFVGRGERGPEVVALFLVDVETPPRRGGTARVEEPTTPEAARDAVLERINALRRAQGLAALVTDPALQKVAQDYSERMVREGFFAHVAPDGSDLNGRLRAAGIRASLSGENLGLAPGPLAAHQGIEHSPGHRNNLLGAQFTHVGLGVSFQTLNGQAQWVLTELFSSGDAAASTDPREEAYQALTRWRATHGLPPPRRLAALERIALEQARRALAANLPPSQLPGEPVHERVFRALDDNARSASVDFYVTDSPARLPDSKNLSDRKTNVMGVGIVRGDSPTYGEGRYWVVVIYAATR